MCLNQQGSDPPKKSSFIDFGYTEHFQVKITLHKGRKSVIPITIQV